MSLSVGKRRLQVRRSSVRAVLPGGCSAVYRTVSSCGSLEDRQASIQRTHASTDVTHASTEFTQRSKNLLLRSSTSVHGWLRKGGNAVAAVALAAVALAAPVARQAVAAAVTAAVTAAVAPTSANRSGSCRIRPAIWIACERGCCSRSSSRCPCGMQEMIKRKKHVPEVAAPVAFA